MFLMKTVLFQKGNGGRIILNGRNNKLVLVLHCHREGFPFPFKKLFIYNTSIASVYQVVSVLQSTHKVLVRTGNNF